MTAYLDVPSASTSGNVTPSGPGSLELQAGSPSQSRNPLKSHGVQVMLERVTSVGGLRNKEKPGRFKEYMLEELDQNSVRIPLSVASFLSGFVGCVTFSACSIWVSFQSGNTVQTFIAVSRRIYDPRGRLMPFVISDWQAMASVLSFALACQFGGRLIPWKRKSRARIVTSAVLQLLLTVAATITCIYTDGTSFNLSRANPSWHNVCGYATLILLSAAAGLQGVVGESLGTGLTATVVLTSIYCQLAVLPSPRKYSKPRDDRLMAILLFGLGGFVAHYPLAGIKSAGTLGIAAGIRLIVIPLWLLCRNADDENVLPRHRRDDTQKQSTQLTITDTNATLVDRPRAKPRFGRIAHSARKSDRPQTAPH